MLLIRENRQKISDGNTQKAGHISKLLLAETRLQELKGYAVGVRYKYDFYPEHSDMENAWEFANTVFDLAVKIIEPKLKRPFKIAGSKIVPI